MAEYPFSKNEADLSLLVLGINASSDISQDVATAIFSDSVVTIGFANDLSQNEQTALSNIVTAHDASQGGQYEAIHKRVNPGSKLTKEEWFENCDAQGVMTGLAKTVDYTWNGNVLLSGLEKTYFKGGVVKEQHEIDYITTLGGRVERKVY